MKKHYSLILVSGLFLLTVFSLISNEPSSHAAGTARLAGMQSGEPPWIPEMTHLRERLNSIGLPALSEEGTAQHIHQHLDLFIHGKAVPVPGAIGINVIERFISPIHTHDSSGIIHIESPTIIPLTLGQFFDVWGVELTSECVGTYCSDKQNSLKLFVNGQAVKGDPRLLILGDHQEIVLTFGSSKEIPAPIPSQYEFPKGT